MDGEGDGVEIISTQFTQPRQFYLEVKNMRRPVIDQNACIGCGLCVTNVPQVFRLADHGKAEVYDSGGESDGTIQREAMDICPVSCIYWQD
jgi:ferredoxin